MTTYVTRQGDTVDFIAWKYYGTQDGRVVERVLEVNAGLADYGPELPENLTVTLPDLPTPVTESGIKLWD